MTMSTVASNCTAAAAAAPGGSARTFLAVMRQALTSDRGHTSTTSAGTADASVHSNTSAVDMFSAAHCRRIASRTCFVARCSTIDSEPCCHVRADAVHHRTRSRHGICGNIQRLLCCLAEWYLVLQHNCDIDDPVHRLALCDLHGFPYSVTLASRV